MQESSPPNLVNKALMPQQKKEISFLKQTCKNSLEEQALSIPGQSLAGSVSSGLQGMIPSVLLLPLPHHQYQG